MSPICQDETCWTGEQTCQFAGGLPQVHRLEPAAVPEAQQACGKAEGDAQVVHAGGLQVCQVDQQGGQLRAQLHRLRVQVVCRGRASSPPYVVLGNGSACIMRPRRPATAGTAALSCF